MQCTSLFLCSRLMLSTPDMRHEEPLYVQGFAFFMCVEVGRWASWCRKWDYTITVWVCWELRGVSREVEKEKRVNSCGFWLNNEQRGLHNRAKLRCRYTTMSIERASSIFLIIPLHELNDQSRMEVTTISISMFHTINVQTIFGQPLKWHHFHYWFWDFEILKFYHA